MTTGKKFPTSLVRLTNPTICVSCEAKIFAYESKLFCCGDGINKISMNEYPSQLIELFSSDSETGIHFRKYCRLYNNVFAFSSLEGFIDARKHKSIMCSSSMGNFITMCLIYYLKKLGNQNFCNCTFLMVSLKRNTALVPFQNLILQLLVC